MGEQKRNCFEVVSKLYFPVIPASSWNPYRFRVKHGMTERCDFWNGFFVFIGVHWVIGVDWFIGTYFLSSR